MAWDAGFHEGTGKEHGVRDGQEADGPGRLIGGRYRLSELLGRGGMGTVWRAHDEMLGRHVALKKMHVPPHLDDHERATGYERTRREARSTARITHPNVVVVYDVVDDGGLPCIVMEYVPSRPLSDVIEQDGPLSPGEAARIGRSMIAALRAAHAAGVLHRDVKPANVLLGTGGRVVLTDFGIAATSDSATLTRTGELIGSVNYCAPERIRGGTPPGPASDLWSLGATLFEAVEGRPPFGGDTVLETMYSITADPPRAPQRAGVLAPLIEQLLTKDPETRPTAEAVELELQEPTPVHAVRADHRPPPPPAGTSVAPVASVASVASVAPTRREVRGEQTAAAGVGGGRLRLGLWAAVAAVLIAAAAGGSYLAQHSNDGGKGRASGAPGEQPSQSASAAPTPSPVPEGYHLVREEGLGVSFPVPDGWSRKQLEDAAEGIAYIDPAGKVGLRISAWDPAGTSPLEHWQNDEKSSVAEGKLPGYEKLLMDSTSYRGLPAALWEFTWQGSAREWQAIDLGFSGAGGQGYAIYLSAPRTEWDTHKPVFDAARDGFRVPGPAS